MEFCMIYIMKMAMMLCIICFVYVYIPNDKNKKTNKTYRNRHKLFLIKEMW